jgi:solute carrier family 25 protein 16
MKTKDKHTLDYTIRSLVAGGIAGSLAKTVVAPLDRVKILFQTFHTNYLRYQGSFLGFFHALQYIKQQYGIRGLMKGHSVTLLRVFPYAGIKFAVYEQIKHQTTFLGHAGEFVSGSGAGIVAVLITYPFDFLRVRLAFDSRSSFLQTVSQVYQEPNRFRILNFYRGVVPTIVGMVPYAGVSFYTYGRLKQFVGQFPLFQNNHPPPHLNPYGTLLCGALSGMVAQTASYPFEVIRRQMQVSKEPTTIAETCKDIMARRGLGGFFVGLSIGYIKVAPLFATSFYSYEYLKRLFQIE